jgi:outer membrane protein
MLLGLGTAQAQKFGYVNTAAVLNDLPEMKQLESSLEAYQNILKKDGEAKVAAFRQKQESAAQKAQRGEMTPKEEETVTAELQKMQEDLYAYGQKMEADLAAKEQKDMEPILTKVNTAIQDVAKEGGYQYIFDAQAGILLYADEASDVTKLVKAKLGLQ